MKDRGIRRKHFARIKAKVTKIVRDVWKLPDADTWLTPRRIGAMASVHLRGCACQMCQNNNTRPKEKWPKIDDPEDD